MNTGKLKLALTALFFCLTASVTAQMSVEQIKNDPNYKWGEGSGSSFKEADDAALQNLSRNILTHIQSVHNDASLTEERNGELNEVYKAENLTHIFSTASIPNSKMMKLSPEPNCDVFRYVHVKDIEAMKEERKARVRTYVRSGVTAESHLQIDDALRSYYWALMLARTNMDTICCPWSGNLENCLTYLPLKLKSVVSHINAKLVDCREEGGRFHAKMHFTYVGHDVASLQIQYFDGQSWVGPMTVKDGYADLELLSLPSDKKIRISYDYQFRQEAEALDRELYATFSSLKSFPLSNMIDIPVNVSEKKRTISAAKDARNGVSIASTAETATLGVPKIKKDTTNIELGTVENPEVYLAALNQVETAIRSGNPESVKELFTAGGYGLFDTLMTRTGKISVVGKEQNYELIDTKTGTILARSCKIKVKHNNGKSFMENLVFRFDAKEQKIQSIAFALSKRAENDIFSSAKYWPEISRFTILNFMEDYQTAYAFKRLSYIDQIYSNDAIILTGTVVKKAPPQRADGLSFSTENENVKIDQYTKKEFMQRLKKQFESREYVHLTFEDNTTRFVNAQRLPYGTVFAIQIKQFYSSPVYSDEGYLNLMFDVSQEVPLIHVRYWYPGKTEMMSLDEFAGKWSF